MGWRDVDGWRRGGWAAGGGAHNSIAVQVLNRVRAAQSRSLAAHVPMAAFSAYLARVRRSSVISPEFDPMWPGCVTLGQR